MTGEHGLKKVFPDFGRPWKQDHERIALMVRERRSTSRAELAEEGRTYSVTALPFISMYLKPKIFGAGCGICV